jgi:hypothetical protein
MARLNTTASGLWVAAAITAFLAGGGTAPGQSRPTAEEQGGGDAGEWSGSLSRATQEAEYRFMWDGDRLTAPNRAQGLRLALEADRMEIEARQGGAERFLLTLGPLSSGEHGAPESPGRRAMSLREAWIERGPITETLRNEEQGVARRIIVREGPDGAGVLRLEQTLGRTLTAYPAGGRSILFRTPSGEAVLRQTLVEARDGRGRILSARQEIGRGSLALVVETMDASAPVTIELLITTAQWTVEGDQAFPAFGQIAVTAGDLNNDGYSDIVVGAPNYDAGQQDEGKIFVYLGGPDGPAATPVFTAEGNEANANFGTGVGPAGDVNNDGYFDLIVGCPKCGADNRGRAILYAGGPGGIAGEVWSADLGAGTESFGQSVATAGDVNGDLFADLIVGAPFNSAGGDNRGTAAIFLGSATWPATTPDRTVSGTADNNNCGFLVATAGNVNGDLYADVLVGCPGSLIGTDTGTARVYHGSATGIGASPSRTLTGETVGDLFGAAVGMAGDVNGDGYTDIAIGAPYFGTTTFPGEGKVYVYHGSSTGIPAAATATRVIGSTGARYGICVGTAGDVNGDGFADLLVGASAYSGGQTNEGRFELLYGRPAGIGAPPLSQSFQSDSAGAFFGASVATAGDVNGDGFSDVLAGAPSMTTPSGNGRVFLYPGGADLPVEIVEWQSDQADAALGTAVAAGDFNADGYSDVVIGTPMFTNGQQNEGKIEVHVGGPDGPDFVADLTVEGAQAGAFFGQALASVGDVNGDGFDDLVVAAPGFNGGQTDEGRVFLFPGSATGLPGTASQFLETNVTSSEFGFAVAGAGDVNGDGFADVIVGEPQKVVAGQLGRAHVYHGGAAGLPASPTLTLNGTGSNNSFGFAVATAGDVNGDGFSDVLVGDPDFNANGRGNAFLFLGGAAGVNPAAFWSNPQIPSAGARYGFALSTLGDMDGDGLSDFAVGEPFGEFEAAQADEGMLHVYYGRPNGLAPGQLDVYQGNTSGGHLGSAVANAGDVNNDGYSDMLIGAPTLGSGVMSLWYGSPSGFAVGTGASPTYTQGGFLPTDLFGAAVAPAGDVNGDGFGDFLVGAPHAGFDNGQANEGHASLYLGGGKKGKDRLPRQRRFDDTAALGLYGKSETTNSFKLKTLARSPMGRDRVALDHEAADLSVPLDGAGLVFGNFFDSGSVDSLGSAINFTRSVTNLLGGPNFHWRFRMRWKSPYFTYSPWLKHAADNVSEKQLRTSCTAALWYADDDGDGHGDPAASLNVCNPGPGYVASSDDCDDGSAARFPGNAEVCDGLDNDCDAAVDEGIAAPTGLAALSFEFLPPPFGGMVLDWPAVSGATGYDVVRGNLAQLRSTGGDFTQAVDACLGDNQSATSESDPAVPRSGDGFFYLVRPVNCGGTGTYDSGGHQQIGKRDSEIDASPRACP